jgi:hypothetical protein
MSLYKKTRIANSIIENSRFTGPAGSQLRLETSSPVTGGRNVGIMTTGKNNLDIKIRTAVMVEVLVRLIDPGAMW